MPGGVIIDVITREMKIKTYFTKIIACLLSDGFTARLPGNWFVGLRIMPPLFRAICGIMSRDLSVDLNGDYHCAVCLEL